MFSAGETLSFHPSPRRCVLDVCPFCYIRAIPSPPSVPRLKRRPRRQHILVGARAGLKANRCV